MNSRREMPSIVPVIESVKVRSPTVNLASGGYKLYPGKRWSSFLNMAFVEDNLKVSVA